jgi:dihydroorotate dehydrogenase
MARRFTPALQTPVTFAGLEFKYPIGLGAGFDKNALYLDELAVLGFGFVEIGTVTPFAQSGNDIPRLFRLPKDKALINRMGFNNDGASVVAERLKQWRSTRTDAIRKTLIVGGNIGKNKNTTNENAWKDYEICFNKLHPFVDYFVVNVSSPNTPGLRELQEKESLKRILTTLQIQNRKFNVQRPIFLKISPDLAKETLDEIIELLNEIKLEGVIIANTTLDRSDLQADSTMLDKIGKGGLSGLPLKQKSDDLLKYVRSKADSNLIIIASGGIFTAADAKIKFNAGADLVQVWTGFIYEGPSIVKNICNGL